MSLIYFHTSPTYQNGKSMARVYELDMLLPQEVKFIVMIHSAKTIFPAIFFFRTQNSKVEIHS